LTTRQKADLTQKILIIINHRHHPKSTKSVANNKRHESKMGDSQRAAELVAKADATLKKWTYFLGGDKHEDALELYEKAANLYKMTKNWEEAGRTFLKTVPCHIKLGSTFEAANAYQNAANCFKKSNKPEAIQALKNAIQILTDMGRFASAAKLEKELGELLEEEQDFESAIQHMQTAADYFDGENQKSSANQCIVKIAHLYGTVEKFDEAIENFEKAARNCVDDRLLKWGAKEYFFKAAACRLAKMKDPEEEISSVKEKIEEYKDEDVHFGSSYEYKCIENMIPAIEKKDIPGFKKALRDYDSIQKLDDWKTSIFLKVLKVLESSVKDVDLT
jgi:alpha-soluble NSF attachment protein